MSGQQKFTYKYGWIKGQFHFKFHNIASRKDKSANSYKRTCQIPYAGFLSDLQRDSDEEETILKLGAKILFPLRAGATFSRFVIKHRNTEAVEDVKTAVLKRTHSF